MAESIPERVVAEPQSRQSQPPPPSALARRVERLEDAQLEIRERLARLEARLKGVSIQMATKADLAALEATLLKWFVGTAVALASLAFAAARFIR